MSDEIEVQGGSEDEKKTCCKSCCGCYSVREYTEDDGEQMTDEEIAADIKENMDKMTGPEREAILAYAEDRAQYKSPFSDEYEEALENDENFRTIFSLSRMQSKTWIDIFCWDLWYFSLQKHPLLGFFAHHAHPLEIADRTLILVTGFSICLINQIVPKCVREVCEETCYHIFLNNGICEDGGNYTWAGTESVGTFAGIGSEAGQAIEGPFACDYGTDCTDCGTRDTLHYRRAAVAATHPDAPGLWCFSNGQIYVKTGLMTFLIIPVSFGLVTNLLLCKCCMTQQNAQKKIFWTDFGQNAGNLFVMSLVTTAGYLVKGYIDTGLNFLALLANKIFIYFLIGGINVVTFIPAYKAEKAKIHKYRGMSNFVQATMSLDGAFDDHESDEEKQDDK